MSLVASTTFSTETIVGDALDDIECVFADAAPSQATAPSTPPPMTMTTGYTTPPTSPRKSPVHTPSDVHIHFQTPTPRTSPPSSPSTPTPKASTRVFPQPPRPLEPQSTVLYPLVDKSALPYSLPGSLFDTLLGQVNLDIAYDSLERQDEGLSVCKEDTQKAVLRELGSDDGWAPSQRARSKGF
ncbi:hypothetical protein PILCRDRAFT_4487 [Piloderma croceum F 1598]|uniref:Uncharacterized protein n=1 Tax=Piloderma croceum (strain F 1598) TaxID=765440 RepID=A0A0C3FQY4_PILCF|nr:hypothetical protein PILCRDRAFT_4487 [Piloderma croceum F 1598]